jgi:catechol 2,3-dioxygenase-like lactoylglutathione lyase family enzyme
MQLAKDHLDIGIFTNRGDEQLAFWQQEAELPFEELLPVGGGVHQHRHAMNGSVFKLNVCRDPVPATTPAGYRELFIARTGIEEPVSLVDPDGNAVTLVPPGYDGIGGIGVLLAVRSLETSSRYYGEALGWEPVGQSRFRCGDTVIMLEEDASQQPVGDLRGSGYRYMTVQVWDVDKEHAAALARGATEGQPPRTLGSTARISFLRDPDGNWLEVSQRASLTGALPGR